MNGGARREERSRSKKQAEGREGMGERSPSNQYSSCWACAMFPVIAVGVDSGPASKRARGKWCLAEPGDPVVYPAKTTQRMVPGGALAQWSAAGKW